MLSAADNRLLLEATHDVEAGRAPKGTDPQAYRDVRAYDDFIPHGSAWREQFAGELVAQW